METEAYKKYAARMSEEANAGDRGLTIGDQGFSMIEIMVALLIVALMFFAIPSSDNSRRHKDLQTAIDDLDRAVRFASNESVLRNRITRLKVDFEKTPVEYTVEYGPQGDFMLPTPEEDSNKNLSVDEAKKAAEKQKKLDAQFNTVPEFAEIRRELPLEVTFLGMATSWQKKIQKNGVAAAYFYPTGERDGTLLVLSTQDEMGLLDVEPFQDQTNAGYQPWPKDAEGRVANSDAFQETKMEEVYQQWAKP